MSEAQRLNILKMLKSSSSQTLTLAESRNLYEDIGQIIPVPDSTTIAVGTMRDVAVEIGKDTTASPHKHLLYFHGGGYAIGSTGSHRGLVAMLGIAAETRTVSVGYRLAPENPLPAAFDDGLAVYRAMLDEGIRGDQIAIAGDSAGGAIAVTVVIRARALGLPMPAAIAMFSPLLDVTADAAAYDERAATDALITRDAVRQMRTLFLGELAPDDATVSPVFADLTGFPPIYLQVGTSEVLIDDALAFARKAMLADVEVRVDAWPCQQHVWQLYAAILDEGAQSIARAGQFLREKLQAPF